ncbi:MAG: hypothetical protein WBL44_00480 [Nitrososphaeraceae archaeon]
MVPIGIGVTVVVEPASGTNLNATIRCFVPDVNIDPGFARNGTNENIDPSFILNDSSLANPCIE